MPTFRHHRGSLEDSMKTCVIVNNREDLAIELSKPDDFLFSIITPDQLIIKPYCFDSRIGWNTQIVLVKPKCITQDIFPVGFLSDKFCEEI